MRNPSMPRSSCGNTGSGGRVLQTGSRGSGPCSTSNASARSSHRSRERPDVIEAFAKQKCAGARDPAVGRLQSEDAAERRGHADRSVGVRPQRQRHQARGHRGRRSTGRSARDPLRIVRIARGSVVRVLGGEAVGVLVHVERADGNRARMLQALHHGGVARRRRALGVNLRPGQGGDARDVEQILHGERDAAQRSGIFARCQAAIDVRRLRQRRIAQHGGEAIQQSVVPIDLAKRGPWWLPPR